ncbi:MAG TPA: hypothetical protein VFG86_23965, partial [Chloroflexota bacterium]|nr:hypothetical protein [Chloroflexota bacterium]
MRAPDVSAFSLHEHARLLILRGRVQDGLFAADDVGATRLPLRWPELIRCATNPWCRCHNCGQL